MADPLLEGLRILVVEDEYSLARDAARELAASGATIIGPVASLADALDLAARAAFDAAVLDVNLGDQMVYPLADALIARRLPFVFSTGYAHADLPERYAGYSLCEKPNKKGDLVRSIARLRQSLQFNDDVTNEASSVG